MRLIDTIAGRIRAAAPTRRPPRRHLLLAVSTAAAAGAAVWAGGLPNRDRFDQLVTIVAGVVFVLLSGVSLRTVADRLSSPVTVRAGASAAHLVRMGLTAGGYLFAMVIALVLMRIPVGQLLLSGAVTGVILGIAAQQTLGNAFAGIILMTSAPFRVGEYITLRSGALGGQYDGYVTDISLTYTTLHTEEGPMSFANATVMASAIGRRVAPEPLPGTASVPPTASDGPPTAGDGPPVTAGA